MSAERIARDSASEVGIAEQAVAEGSVEGSGVEAVEGEGDSVRLDLRDA